MRDFLDIFDREYGPKLGIRAPTFRAVIREAVTLGVMTIVETGCMRQPGNWEGDGQSTIVLSALANFMNADFTSVDLSEEALLLAGGECPKIRVKCMDSVKYLNERVEMIDLLYLDSFDVDMGAPHPAALHCLFELCAARPKLHKNSIVCVDDSPMSNDWVAGGKGLYVAQYMKQLGINPFTFGYQTAWVMP